MQKKTRMNQRALTYITYFLLFVFPNYRYFDITKKYYHHINKPQIHQSLLKCKMLFLYQFPNLRDM